MILHQLKLHFTESLSSYYPIEEVNTFFNWLAEYYLGYSRLDISLKGNQEISTEDQAKFLVALKRLQGYEPIQYIIGETEFYGLPFKVSPATLIPRVETEELVAWIVSKFNGGSVLDIGTGSGCIAVALAKHLKEAKVSGLDISEAALKIASENSIKNNVDINFFQADILATASLPCEFDVIVSNPPYVREQEKKQMKSNVLEHEPKGALFVTDKDPLLYYKKITSLAKTHLKPDGQLFFEINEYLSDEMCELLTAEGFTKIELKQDIFGKDRMIKCSL